MELQCLVLQIKKQLLIVGAQLSIGGYNRFGLMIQFLLLGYLCVHQCC